METDKQKSVPYANVTVSWHFVISKFDLWWDFISTKMDIAFEYVEKSTGQARRPAILRIFTVLLSPSTQMQV
jgi:hypothetical protein